MIRLYFNGAALIQFVIVVVLYFLYAIVDEYVMHLTNDVRGNNIMIVALQAAAFFCAFTDVRGLHGRLFFLPTWLICIAVSLFLFGTEFYNTLYPKMAVYLSSILIIVYYFYKIPARIKKEWEKKKAARRQLEAALSAHKIADSSFWSMASDMYYNPSLLFLYGYRIWRYIFRNAIDDREFIEHYRFLLNNMPVQSLSANVYKRWMTNLKNALNNANDMKNYKNPVFGFTRLKNTINEQPR